jgi:hypothetical protein
MNAEFNTKTFLYRTFAVFMIAMMLFVAIGTPTSIG